MGITCSEANEISQKVFLIGITQRQFESYTCIQISSNTLNNEEKFLENLCYKIIHIFLKHE